MKTIIASAYHVIRGGSFGSGAWGPRCIVSFRYSPVVQYESIGFRFVVRQ
jgi:formylglycine-generating enzyme required for sulfatase activity